MSTSARPRPFGGIRTGPHRFPLHLGIDPGARISLRALRRTLGRQEGERVVDPSAPAFEATEHKTVTRLAPRVIETRVEPSASSDAGSQGSQLIASHTVHGDRVVSRTGETLGRILDVMIDVRDGRVAYAVLTCGGEKGFADRLYPVPWPALTLDPGGRRFVFDITREALLVAPNFHQERWPDMADPFFARTVHAYYGLPVYREAD